MHLSTLSTDPASQLNVLGHDGDTLGVNGAEIGVLEQTHQVGLACFLRQKKSKYFSYLANCWSDQIYTTYAMTSYISNQGIKS